MSESKEPLAFKSAHFIGIGGAGMSGIALVLHERGCAVSGSDLKESRYVRELMHAGIDVHIGHEAATIDLVSPDVIVTSSAIPETNPEVIRARELGIAVWPRAQMLSALGHGFTTVAVAGTHGKTTTSSMMASMLDHLGLDPSFLIGGIVEEYGTNGRDGRGGYFVCEADESDGSFLYLDPDVVVVTNIEADHLDHYGTLENIERTFCEFMNLVGDAGTIIINGDNPHYIELAKSTGKRVISYGFDESNDFVCLPHASSRQLASSCDVRCPDGRTITLTISANPGRHNLSNATACVAAASALTCNLDEVGEAISQFKGAHRRFTHVGELADINVVDDYGHHPTEIRATLEAASELGYERIVTVFQPHRYSRTQALMEDFAHAFDAADLVFIMDVFPAGEMPIPGVTGRVLAARIADLGKAGSVAYVDHRREVIARLCEACKPGDLVITQGAGDVTSIGPDFLAALRDRLAEDI